MPFILVFGALAAWLSIPFLLGETFGRGCGKAFEQNSAQYEKCVRRLSLQAWHCGIVHVAESRNFIDA